MKILYAASEAAPFVKTGGLGDVAGSLPVTLKEKGEDVRVILPLYRCIDQKYKDMMKYITHIYIDLGWRKQYCGVFSMEYKGTIYYFVDNEYYFGGDKPYDFIHLDCEKFIFFSKAVLSLLPTLDFRPDVINCNDWQTAPIPVFLDTFYDNPFYRGIKTVMTIHNLKFQGRWDLEKIKDAMAIGDYYFTSDKLEYYKDANLLKGGLVYANKISTVSKTYANEIMSPEYGEGLDGLLRAREGDLVGIVNGISDDRNPETDELIVKKYSKKTLSDKKINKTELQKELGLEVNPDKFMIGIVSRLTGQKGIDLVAYIMDVYIDKNNGYYNNSSLNITISSNIVDSFVFYSFDNETWFNNKNSISLVLPRGNWDFYYYSSYLIFNSSIKHSFFIRTFNNPPFSLLFPNSIIL